MNEGSAGFPEDIDAMTLVLAALANQHRLRILALLLNNESIHVSQLAREVGLSRPLLYLHLRRLEEAGLIEGHHELSEDGKALKIFRVRDWGLHITPEAIRQAALKTPPAAQKPKKTP